jgi:hypothetical protein
MIQNGQIGPRPHEHSNNIKILDTTCAMEGSFTILRKVRSRGES